MSEINYFEVVLLCKMMRQVRLTWHDLIEC
jgi:hypothetical protein